MSALVFLVRHATHCDLGRRLTGRGGCRLAAVGELQAAALGRRLHREGLAAVHTSPSERARATALAIAQSSGLRPEVAPALDEIDFGDWTGARFEDLEDDAHWRHWNRERGTARAPNGETMAAATGRMVGHIEQAAKDHDGACIALVSHCDTIRGVVAHYLGMPLDRVLRFAVDPASVSRLRIADGGAELVSLNETAE